MRACLSRAALAVLLLLPSSARAQTVSLTEPEALARLSMAQLLPINGQRSLQVRAASALADASASRADEEVRRARADLRLAFAQLAAAQIREQELTAARDRLRELANILAKREAAGD